MVASVTYPLVQSYILYSAILALKLLSVGMLTILNRISQGIFANSENANGLGEKSKLDNQGLERIRRAHRNDLENIPAFWLLGALYVTTNPAVPWAKLLFRVYTISRIVHTFVYAVVPMPQPSRITAYLIPYTIKWYMIIQIVLYYLNAL